MYSSILNSKFLRCPSIWFLLIYLLYQARIQRAGKDITLAAHSIGVHFCVEAAEELAKEGISAEIINLRSVRPLDMEAINESVKKTHHLITVEGKYLKILMDGHMLLDINNTKLYLHHSSYFYLYGEVGSQ